MPISTNSTGEFDLTPHPRILPMLGEIVLPQWRCLAELIDNSVDSFLESLRAGSSVQNPQVSVNVPTIIAKGARIVVRDNGPGMDWQTLERAARAGWTSHDPINNLGLFGMGFNIATARLGAKTTIWTTRTSDREWVGLQIDFEELIRKKEFATAKMVRPKLNPDISGTEVIIERLKPEQLDWFSRAQNRSTISKQLGKIYSSMIGPAGAPLSFRLEINGSQTRPKLHCIWGGPGNSDRTIETARYGAVSSFQPFDIRLEPRPFCNQCWNWLAFDQTSCSYCENSETIVQRERRVHGWLAVQRYLDRDDYGIDFLRNGRKIEIGNKDLFGWRNEDLDSEEVEYPIDDPRDRGRIVGEVHLNHCRVPYTKDRFVREDAAWREMIEIVRGRTPLRPDIAAKLAIGENSSPLFRLFQAFRRSNPHNKRVGGWSKILVVPDNDRALAMAKRFDAGESEYFTDQKWYELVEEADAEVLQGTSKTTSSTDVLGGSESEGPEAADSSETPTSNDPTTSPATSAPERTRLASLSQQYIEDISAQRFTVEAFAVSASDPALSGMRSPWNIRRTTQGPWEFYVDIAASVFRSMTFTPLDALLSQLAWLIADFERGQGGQLSFGETLASLRQKYAASNAIDPQNLISEASAQMVEIARSIFGRITKEDSINFFDEIPPSRQENVRVVMASRGVANPHSAIGDGRFLQYAPPSIIRDFILSHPDMFFDGNYWDEPYSEIDYGSAAATDEARSRILGHYGGLLADVVWLAQQTPAELADISRERLMRASLAIALLSPTSVAGDVA